MLAMVLIYLIGLIALGVLIYIAVNVLSIMKSNSKFEYKN